MKKVTKDSRILTAGLPQSQELMPTQTPWKIVLGIGILLFSGSLTVILVGLLHTTYTRYQYEIAEKKAVIQNLDYWEGIVEKYPHFPAAYYEAAVYAARLEEREQAKEFLQKALMIDPNFFEAEALARELE